LQEHAAHRCPEADATRRTTRYLLGRFPAENLASRPTQVHHHHRHRRHHQQQQLHRLRWMSTVFGRRKSYNSRNKAAQCSLLGVPAVRLQRLAMMRTDSMLYRQLTPSHALVASTALAPAPLAVVHSE